MTYPCRFSEISVFSENTANNGTRGISLKRLSASVRFSGFSEVFSEALRPWLWVRWVVGRGGILQSAASGLVESLVAALAVVRFLVRGALGFEVVGVG